MSVDLGHWVLNNGVELPEDFEENPPIGFVYKVFDKDTGMFYIGQKKITKIERKPPLKGKVRKRKVVKQTDWKTYRSSCNDLKREISNRGEDHFEFIILMFCDTKWELS